MLWLRDNPSKRTNHDDNESESYVRPLLQLETDSHEPAIRSDIQFSFQITTKRGCKMAAT